MPEPLNSIVYKMRKLIPGKELPKPHITVLPPRSLRTSPELACEQIGAVLARFAAFEVTLSEIRYFAETNFLYIDIAQGARRVDEIHEALNVGELFAREAFQFHPHLTLLGPIPEERAEKAIATANKVWQAAVRPDAITVDELVCLWSAVHQDSVEWRRLTSYPLATARTAAEL